MEKIKMNFNFCENKIIKLGKNKIEIRPYIDTKDCLAIEQICLKQFNSESTELAMVKCIYDMFVVFSCTNIEVEGFSSELNKENLGVNINLKAEDIEFFEKSGIIQVVSPYIFNYETEYQNILELLKMENIKISLSLLKDLIPDSDNLTDTLKSSIKELSKEMQERPEDIKRVANDMGDAELIKEIKKVSKGKSKK